MAARSRPAQPATMQVLISTWMLAAGSAVISSKESFISLLADYVLAENTRQPQGQVGYQCQQADHGEQHDHERQAAYHDVVHAAAFTQALDHEQVQPHGRRDRKSTRLNSRH